MSSIDARLVCLRGQTTASTRRWQPLRPTEASPPGFTHRRGLPGHPGLWVSGLFLPVLTPDLSIPGKTPLTPSLMPRHLCS